MGFEIRDKLRYLDPGDAAGQGTTGDEVNPTVNNLTDKSIMDILAAVPQSPGEFVNQVQDLDACEPASGGKITCWNSQWDGYEKATYDEESWEFKNFRKVEEFEIENTDFTTVWSFTGPVPQDPGEFINLAQDIDACEEEAEGEIPCWYKVDNGLSYNGVYDAESWELISFKETQTVKIRNGDYVELQKTLTPDSYRTNTWVEVGPGPSEEGYSYRGEPLNLVE